MARSAQLSAVQLFAAAVERPYGGPALKRLVSCEYRGLLAIIEIRSFLNRLVPDSRVVHTRDMAVVRRTLLGTKPRSIDPVLLGASAGAGMDGRICLPHERVRNGLWRAQHVDEHLDRGDGAELGGAQDAHDDGLGMRAVEGAIAA